MIIEQGGQFIVKSKDGDRDIGVYSTREEAAKRVRQMGFFGRQRDAQQNPLQPSRLSQMRFGSS